PAADSSLLPPSSTPHTRLPFFFHRPRPHRDLPSFPTRRSSDLWQRHTALQGHRGAAGRGRGREVVPVDTQPADRHEQVARKDVTRVLNDPAHIEFPSDEYGRARHSCREQRQSHRQAEHTELMAAVGIIGIVNVTRASFSGDGFMDHGAAIARGLAMARAGAQIVEVGGESTRPGHAPVAAREEIERAVPVVGALAREGLTVSIDTSKLEVARAAADAGATIVNDIWGLKRSPGIASLAAERGLRLGPVRRP